MTETTIPDLMRHAASTYGAREFLRFPDTSLSFAEADERSGRMAGALIDQGVRPGDRVAIMMDNVPGWPLSWLAVLKAGAVTVPVNVRYRAADLEHVLRDSGAVATITTGEHAPHVPGAVHLLDALRDGTPRPPRQADPDDVANFQYTSGTTGFPKACMLTHDYWLRTARIAAGQVELRDDDVMMIAQAYSYMDPQWVTLLCLMGGIPLVVLPRFSASGFWASAREHGATLTYVLGTMPLLLHKQPPHPHDRDNRMRVVLCSGIQPGLHATFEERWGAPWRELYGSTESGPDLISPLGATDTVGTGALGVAPPGKEVTLDEETGEILVRGVPMMKGYWNHPEATAHAFRGGWYHTGDLGVRDEHGRLRHAGRIKDMVRRGGENISCAEVEHVLAQHPAVLSAALVPVADDLWGEVPKAFIQLRPGHAGTRDTAMSVIGHARERLARFKIPAYVEFVEEFALTPSARIEKRHLLSPGRDQRAAPAIQVPQPDKEQR
ncbi:acyl-CoA synthetase (AMP-forming)/AMP-acid ligase II [Nonomuraea thailandensis]|uniref:Acyl-CoA synthetase (AMP-forming)/AMP-acid ligase II n=1 Tax=Nonomuraea thailandensis TaxID=1188745 RepID=A0A9X2GQ77_9ACTN|nr:AMP-binding protein [Nonomuraea thailandensis]MCP2362010.1 acyl-CoA synthetase (AMP-forming)/AMP-acid ligase II [Nonomuraea thailandensis]